MINTEKFINILLENNINFFTGVPDSLLKDFCNKLPTDSHIIAANEGTAVSLAAGSYLATGKIPLVYMQNSGLGNAINPLLSLTDLNVYAIPMIIMIGWRGEPNTYDEPQHIKQGMVTEDLLKSMQIPYDILDSTTINIKDFIFNIVEKTKLNTPVVILVKKNTFKIYKNTKKLESGMTQYQAIRSVINCLGENSIIVSTTGYTSRILNEIRPYNPNNFLVVGSMGHANQVALGLSVHIKDKLIVCLDGDGSILMHMGTLATIGKNANRYLHIILNNSSHMSVGGQPTTNTSTDFCSIAKACGYKSTQSVDNNKLLENFLLENKHYPSFLEIKINNEVVNNLSRPDLNFYDKKTVFMNTINK